MTNKKGKKSKFEKALSGRFEGILRWADLDKLWARLKAADGAFYVYEVGTDVPDKPLGAKALAARVDEINKILRDNHDEDYCGIVYVDDPDAPSLIKVFGPKNLGASCGTSGSKIWPRWVISKVKPSAVGVELDEAGKPAWWKSFSFKRT